jgi:hypothetical protein
MGSLHVAPLLPYEPGSLLDEKQEVRRLKDRLLPRSQAEDEFEFEFDYDQGNEEIKERAIMSSGLERPRRR